MDCWLKCKTNMGYDTKTMSLSQKDNYTRKHEYL